MRPALVSFLVASGTFGKGTFSKGPSADAGSYTALGVGVGVGDAARDDSSDDAPAPAQTDNMTRETAAIVNVLGALKGNVRRD